MSKLAALIEACIPWPINGHFGPREQLSLIGDKKVPLDQSGHTAFGLNKRMGRISEQLFGVASRARHGLLE